MALDLKGSEHVLGVIIAHLKSRRLNEGDAQEATGICTHHLDHDENLWHFLDEFADFTTSHQAVRWVCLNGELK